MCTSCNKVRGLVKKGNSADALALIGNAIKGGRSAEHFEDLLDEIVGTKMPVRDEKTERNWENGYRKSKVDAS